MMATSSHQVESNASPERDRLGWEFGCYALWLAEAINALSVDPIPAACRGTGHPLILEGLAHAMGLRPGCEVLDLGSGIGGPGAWLRQQGCSVVGVELMEESARGARLLFSDGIVLMADSSHLPFSGATFDAAWALGSLETMTDKVGALAEVRRVLRAGGRFGAYSIVPVLGCALEFPLADRFEPGAALADAMQRAGFTVIEAGPVGGIGKPPRRWQVSGQALRDDIARRHGSDPRYDRCVQEVRKISELYRSEAVSAWRFIAVKGAPR